MRKERTKKKKKNFQKQISCTNAVSDYGWLGFAEEAVVIAVGWHNQCKGGRKRWEKVVIEWEGWGDGCSIVGG